MSTNYGYVCKPRVLNFSSQSNQMNSLHLNSILNTVQALSDILSTHGSYRSVIFVLFFLYFGSTGIPSDIKLCLTAGSTTWSDFSSRMTITSAENPDFEIWLELNSPDKFSTAYSTNNRVDSSHRKLFSYRQNRNDAKIYSSVRVAILTLVRKFNRGKRQCAYTQIHLRHFIACWKMTRCLN